VKLFGSAKLRSAVEARLPRMQVEKVAQLIHVTRSAFLIDDQAIFTNIGRSIGASLLNT